MIPYAEPLNPAFLAGLAGRYVVKQEVGRGATATVYLAEDVRHKRRVAIKVLHPSIATAISEQRFLREIAVAARLTHPNILPVLDSGEAAGLLYYVMPFVEDRTLRDVLRERGVLPVTDSIRIAAEIAEALDYAHRQGVVHRDIKPGNILLVADHPLISDFGIALVTRESEGDPVTQPGDHAVGTPAYMSPEQATPGATVDGRSDTYSLGIVLREMLTGVRSLHAQGSGQRQPSLTDLRKRVATDPVPRWLIPVLGRALAHDPADRYRRAGDMARALKTEHRRLSSVSSVALTLLGVGVGALVWTIAHTGRGEISTSVHQRVAVAEFVNRTGDSTLAYLGIMASDWITEGLHQTGLVDVVPTPTALQASRFATSQVVGQRADPVQMFAAETNASIVVTGSYYRVGSRLQIQVQVADVANSRVLGAVTPIVVSIAAPNDAIDSVRTRVMGLLATTLDERLATSVALSAHPPTFEAYREFAIGLDDYVRNDFAASARQFIAAINRDSAFATAHLMASISLSNQGLYAQADSVLSRLLARRGNLGPYHQHWFDYRRSILRGDRHAALIAIRELASMSPRTKATYNWAVEAMQNGYLDEARTALRSLQPGAGPMRGWAPYWDVLGRVEHMLGNHQAELEAGVQSRKMFPDRIYVLGTSVRALAALGRRAQVEALINEARRMSADPLGTSVGELALEAAMELRAHGHQAASRSVLALGLLWYEERSATAPLRTGDRLMRARSYYEMGDYYAAAYLADSLLAEQPLNPEFLGIAARAGARSADSTTFARSLATLLGLPRTYALGIPTFEASRSAAARGDTELAIRQLSISLGNGKEFDLWAHRDTDLLMLATDSRYRELVRLKR